MKDKDISREQLIAELSDLRQRVEALEDAEEGRRQMQWYLEAVTSVFLSLGVDPVENMQAILHAGKEILGGEIVLYYRLARDYFTILSTLHEEEGFLEADRPEGYVCYDVVSNDEDAPITIEDLSETGFEKTDPFVKEYGFRSFLGYPVRHEGKVLGCLCLYNTEEREFSKEEIEIAGLGAKEISIEEERLAHEQELRSFIDVASHELRHPVTIVNGYATCLENQWDSLDEDKKKLFLTDIVQGAERLSKLVDDFLDVSRIGRGSFPVEKRKAHITPLVERAIAEMRSRGATNDFDSSISYRVDSINLDPEKIVEVLIILLDNAVNFSPDDSRIEVNAEPENEGIVVSVVDRGVGIAENIRGKIFERFFQGDDSEHHFKPGIGIGLYIAREIVDAHGGRIWCEPRDGGGSVFSFTLPD
jgi:signal transduction histidine kinase